MTVYKEDNDCPQCGSSNTKHKDVGGYAYACVDSKCQDCGFKWRWANLND